MRLTGQLPQHPDNHWGTVTSLNNTQLVALDYFAGFGATLGVNDLSLRQGGLFDIASSWQTPHLSHRKGTSVDFDGTACLDPNLGGGCSGGTLRVDKQFIGRRCLERGRGFLLPEYKFTANFRTSENI